MHQDTLTGLTGGKQLCKEGSVEYETVMCPQGKDGQQTSGLHQENYCQQNKGHDPSPLILPYLYTPNLMKTKKNIS